MRDDNDDVDHIPGERGLPLINRTFEYLRDPFGTDKRTLARYGSIARTRMFGRTVVMLGSADHASRLLLDRERTLSNRFGWGHFFGELLSNGLMLRDFDEHRLHRGIMQVAFRSSARAAYHEEIDRHFAHTVARWAGERMPMQFYPAIRNALIEQAGSAFLGIPPGPHVEFTARCFTAVRDAMMAVIRVELPGTAWRRGMIGRRKLAAFLRAEIPARRRGHGRDLFSQLCHAEDENGERFDDDAVVDHMIFLLFAAHDTTSSALTTLIDELTRAPELQERAAQECLSLPRLGFEQLEQLEFVDRCFREAIRLQPPVNYILRRTTSACPIGGHLLPERTPATLIVHAVHHDPELWTDPLRFDPDRFAPERAEDRGHPHAWVPFGGGAHRCIGAEFSRQQVKVFCWHLLRRFRIERVREGATVWRQLPIPMPKDGLPVRLVAR
jgi:cytochrome P450